MHLIRRHLSYANVVATLALLFAMSGGALAASHYLINSTKQINPKVLKKLKGTVGSTGPSGAQGQTGAQGANGKEGLPGKDGPRGPSDVYEVELSETTEETAANTARSLTLANLPAGSYAIFGKATLAPFETKPGTSRCKLTAGTDTDETYAIQSTVATFIFGIDTQISHTFATTGNVIMSCLVSGDKWQLRSSESAGSTRILAIRLDSQHKTTAPAG
jgi:hypothetical protein